MATGRGTTYDLTVGVKLDFEDFIYVLTPTDVPLLGTFNGTDVPAGAGRSILSRETATEKKIEWSEEELLTPRTTLGATAATSDTFITVASGQRERFSTGDVVRIVDEFLRITGYGSTADTLTVTRAYADSTQVQQANAAAVVGVGTALNEGSDPEDARFKDRDAKHNHHEIFGPHKVDISGTEEVVLKYGVTSEFHKQISNRLREMFVAIEQALLLGKRYEDSGNKRRLMGGLAFYIDTNKDTSTTDVTEAKLLDQFQNTYDNGGVVDTLIVGATQKRKLSALRSSDIRFGRPDRVRGQVVDIYESDFSVADIVLDRHARTRDLFGIDRQYCTVSWLRPAHAEMLAKTGDSMKAMVLAEASMKVRMEKRHFKFTALQ